jgi:hypothetical protein
MKGSCEHCYTRQRYAGFNQASAQGVDESARGHRATVGQNPIHEVRRAIISHGLGSCRNGFVAAPPAVHISMMVRLAARQNQPGYGSSTIRIDARGRVQVLEGDAPPGRALC